MSTKGNVHARTGSGAGKAEGAAHDEAIRYRAYELYLSRSAAGVPGDPLSDWLQAERDITSTEKKVRSDRSNAGDVSSRRTRRSSAP